MQRKNERLQAVFFHIGFIATTAARALSNNNISKIESDMRGKMRSKGAL
jgi:hypothetical protein